MQQNAKYQVEDDLDLNFFEALKTMQQKPTASLHNADNADDDACLITNEPLNSFHVALQCGHKFNYEPLYQEVLRQKGRLGIHNYQEKIEANQIKCPYCRSMTNQLLPYVGHHPTVKRLVGVNAPASMCMQGVKCHVDACHANAFYEHGNRLHCLRHYKIALKSKTPSSTKAKLKTSEFAMQCAAEIQTGKNKGRRCNLNAGESNLEPPLCKKHSKCNVVLFQMDSHV